MEARPTLSERAAQVIWPPFTQMQTADPVIGIYRGKGSYLFAEDGTAYLDGISSWMVNLHGHAHPYISEKIATQVHILEHTIFPGFTHQPAVEFAERLTSLTGMDKLFYSDNGSTAVEIGIKMALQFWHNQNPETKRVKILSFQGGYHGETFGAMSAAGKNGFNHPFWKHLFPVETLPPPSVGKEEFFLSLFETLLQKEEIAAFLFEPLVQAVGGMNIYSKKGLDAALELCQKYEVITIADEVMTGFGRTGTLFACDQLIHQPDILCLSKGATGGYLPLGATLCCQKIYDAFLSSSFTKALLHGHSFSANPLACTAACASLDLLLKEECLQQREWIATSHRQFVKTFASHPSLLRCESLGTLLILEYDTSEESGYFNPIREHLYRHFLDNKILLRPFGNVIYVLPPYCIQPNELKSIYSALEASL